MAPRGLPAAASPRVRDLLAGPVREARVLHRGEVAVYLEVGGRCLGVVTPRASAVPCALLVTTLPPALTADHPVLVGDGALRVADTALRVTRLRDVSVPALPTHLLREAHALLTDLLGPEVAAVRAELPDAALRDLADGSPAAVAPLLGLGSGLTPVGDDVLAGFLATCVAAGTDVGPFEPAVDGAAERTTLLSATLLDCARHGEVLPEFARVLRALAVPGAPHAGAAVGALARVGHTSGAGLTLGASLALTHLTAPLTAGGIPTS